MVVDPGGFTLGITFLILLSFGLLSAILVMISRRRMVRKESEAEEGQVVTRSVSVSRYPPQLPNFSTRSSLSMSEPSSSRSPRTPGIRFIITTPSHRSRNSGSINSLPSMEAVLEKYEQEADAAGEHVHNGEEDKMLSDVNLGEPGPSVISGKDRTKDKLQGAIETRTARLECGTERRFLWPVV